MSAQEKSSILKKRDQSSMKIISENQKIIQFTKNTIPDSIEKTLPSKLKKVSKFEHSIFQNYPAPQNLLISGREFKKPSIRPSKIQAKGFPNDGSSSPRRMSVSRFGRNRGSKKNTEAGGNLMNITLQDLLFKQKLERFIKNIRSHSGMNDVVRLNSEKLRIINDLGAWESVILNERTLSEIRLKNQSMSKGKSPLLDSPLGIKHILMQIQKLATQHLEIFRSWLKTTFNFLNENIPVLKPFGKFKITWEIIMLLFTMWNLLSLSLILSFGISLQESFSLSASLLNNENCLLGFQILCLILYNADIVIKFNTGIYSHGELVHDRNKIIKSYITSGLFFDLLGTVPFWLSLWDISDANNRQLYFFLFKLYPLKVFFTNINEALLNIEGGIEAAYYLIKLLLTILSVCHIFACIWHYQAYTASVGQKNWIFFEGLQDSYWSERYLRSLYFTVVTMTTVGYGDISPKNDLEYFIAMACMLIGSGLIGYSINSIGAILKKRNKEEMEFRSKMQLVNSYLKKNKVESALKIKVRKYLEYLWKIENTANEKKCEEILKELPTSIREDLLAKSRMWAMQSIFGSKFKSTTITRLVNNLEYVQFSKEEMIFQEGESTENYLYVVAKGVVQLILNEGNINKRKYITLNTKKAGDIIGLNSFFMDTKKQCSAKAGSVCSLFKLSKTKFLEIIKENSEDYETFCMIRDKLLLYNDKSILGLKCASCGDINHSLRYCPLISYQPFKKILIKKHLHSFFQKRHPFIRSFESRKKYRKTLLIANEIRSSVIEFHEHLPDLIEMTSNHENNITCNEIAANHSNNEISILNEELLQIDTKFKDESKDDTNFSKDDINLKVDENIRNLTENVPFKSHCLGEIILAKEEGDERKDPVNHRKNQTLLHPFSQQEFLLKSDISSDDSKFDDKRSMENLATNKPNYPYFYDRTSRKAGGEKKSSTILGLRPPNPKFSIVLKSEPRSCDLEPGENRDKGDKEEVEKTIRTQQTYQCNSMRKIAAPLFCMDIDKGCSYSIYFPHNNKVRVIERLKRR